MNEQEEYIEKLEREIVALRLRGRNIHYVIGQSFSGNGFLIIRKVKEHFEKEPWGCIVQSKLCKQCDVPKWDIIFEWQPLKAS